MRKFALLLFAFALALAPPILAQSSGTITTTSVSCPSLDASRIATVGIQVTGTWTGTLQPEISIQGQAPQNTQVAPSTAQTTPQGTITANGYYYAAGGGVVYLCGPTSTGTANVYFQPIPGSAKNFGGGGSGGGVSSVGLSLPASLFTVSGSPVSSSGTLAGSFITNFAANEIFGNCTASTATPGACTITSAMLPAALSSQTSVNSTSIPSGITWPATKASVSHQWLNSFTQSTGAYTSSQPASTDLSDYGSVSTTGLFGATINFSGATQVKLPVAAGFATLANGELGYDSTNSNWHFWQNAADKIAALFSGTLTNGDCAEIQVLSSVVNLIDAGAACGSGGGNTTSTSLTTSVVPKANGANSIINSLLSDNGTTLSYTGTGGIASSGPLTTNSSSNLCGSSTPCIGGAEGGTAPTPAAGDDFLFLSNSHYIQQSVNGSALEPIPAMNGSFIAGHMITVKGAFGGTADLKDAGIFSCTEVWVGSGTSNALQSGDDAVSNNTCFNDSGVTRTITAVKCRSDNASNTTTVNPTFGSAGTGTTILSAALTCGSSYAYSSSGTVSSGSWTTGTGIDPAMSGTLTGTSIAMIVEYTQ